MKGFTRDEIFQILEFIYRGEVTLETDQISKFFELGRKLQIKGLPDETNFQIKDTKEESKMLTENDDANLLQIQNDIHRKKDVNQDDKNLAELLSLNLLITERKKELKTIHSFPPELLLKICCSMFQKHQNC